MGVRARGRGPPARSYALWRAHAEGRMSAKSDHLGEPRTVSLNRVQRQLQVAHAIDFGGRQLARLNIHLDRRQDKRRHL